MPSLISQIIESLSPKHKKEALGILREWEQGEMEKQAQEIELNYAEKQLCATGVSSDRITAIKALYKRLDIGLVTAKIVVEKYCQDQKKSLILQVKQEKSVASDIKLM